MAQITFSEANIAITLSDGSDLIHLCDLHSPLKFGCKQGHCGVCAIKVTSGNHHLTKSSKEELRVLDQKGKDKTYRLACQCAINGNITIGA